MISFENVTKVYPDGTRSVNGLNLTIKKGEFFVFIGPSGCGKTTTLKMINRLIELTEGSIRLNDKNVNEYDVHELRWNIGYVLQQIALFPHLTIEENIAIVPELKKWDKGEIKKRVSELLEMVGLDPSIYRHRKPSELSGGEQQRVGVIRALAADPDIILMDEPFSALDPISREKLQQDITDLQKRIQKTIVFVTHDMQEALTLGDRIGIMRGGELIQVDTPDQLIAHPANAFVSDFIGDHTARIASTNWLHGTILEKMIRPLPKDRIPDELSVISHTATVEFALKQLSEKEILFVKKEDAIIGVIDRPSLLKVLGEKLGVTQ